MRPPVQFKWRGIHHSYLGAWFIGFGLFFLYMNQGNSLNALNILYSLFIITGLYLVIDDYMEHTVTADTPLRLLWEFMLKKKEWW